jgi:uncharacterized protein
MREAMLSFLLTVISRLLLRSDRLSGRMGQVLGEFSLDKERLVIPSGGRRLSAVYVSAGKDTPAILICHGIGELVEYWGRVQGLLKEMGVSSLVFNYSGYGASSGFISAARCEEDAVAAYRELVDRGHQSIVLLGFSLGSGIGLRGGFVHRCGWTGFVRGIFIVSRGGDRDGLSALDDTRGAQCLGYRPSGMQT